MNKKNNRKIRQLAGLLDGASSLLIVLQNHPDPDALSAAAALRLIANRVCETQCRMVHGGNIGRVENRAMAAYLGLSFHAVETVDMGQHELAAAVDTQPGMGNNLLPDDDVPAIVIDHHPLTAATRGAAFTDIRSGYGATATILTEYLVELGLEPDARLATALLYGIRADTHDRGGEIGPPDIRALTYLYPLANKRRLYEIEWGGVSEGYYRVLAEGLKNARICGTCIVTDLGAVEHPDMVSEVADLLLRNEQTTWVLSHGRHDRQAVFSVRTFESDADAGDIARRIAGTIGAGGGHRELAAGQIPLKTGSETAARKAGRLITRRFLDLMGHPGKRGRKLV